MSTVFATATILAATRSRHDYQLFIIGAVAFTVGAVGYQHRRRHRRDTGHILGIGVGYVAILTAFYVDNGPHLPLGTACRRSSSGSFPQLSARQSSSERSSAPGLALRKMP
jgi:hypothetical protein